MSVHGHSVPLDKCLEEVVPLRLPLAPQATPWGTAFNMFKNIVGAGLLGLPYALGQLGLVGLLVMCCSALLSVTALYFIIHAIDIIQCRGDSKPFSYKAIATAAFGEQAGAAIDLIVMFYTGFGLVAYSVLIADFFGPPLRHSLGPGPWDTTQGILCWAAVAVFGLCCLPSMEALKFTSLAGNVALLYAVLLVVYEWFTSTAPPPHIEWSTWNPTSIKVMGIFTAAFNFHYNMPIFYGNLQPYPLGSMMRLTVRVILLALGALYIPMALFGYLTLGGAVQSNVLRNFGNDTRFLACRLGLGGMIVATFPIVASSTRAALGRLASLPEPLPPRLQASLSFLIVAFACSVACVVPSFGVVVAYNGAIFGTAQQLVFPAAAFLSLSRGQPGLAGQRVAAVVVAAVGVALAVLGAAAQTHALLHGGG